jgi:hypothetical protein
MVDQECEQVTVEKNRKIGKFTRAARKKYYKARTKGKRRIIMKNNVNNYKNVMLKMTVGSPTSKLIE